MKGCAACTTACTTDTTDIEFMMELHWGALPDFARLTRLSLQNENRRILEYMVHLVNCGQIISKHLHGGYGMKS